jgi:hypothetical protein
MHQRAAAWQTGRERRGRYRGGGKFKNRSAAPFLHQIRETLVRRIDSSPTLLFIL